MHDSTTLDSTALAADSTLVADSIPAADTIPAVRERMVLVPTGIVGSPVSYEFRNDDTVTTTLLVVLFAIIWIVTRSRKFLKGQLHDFFYVRERANLFSEREETTLHGGYFLILATCFIIALFSLTVCEAHFPQFFTKVPSYVMLACTTLMTLVYYSVKLGLYTLVDSTFFSPAKRRLWRDTYTTSILVTGAALLPVVLQVIFFDLPMVYAIYECVLLLAVIKTLLLYKCYRIFFNTWLGRMHIILYFCALEIIPLGIFLAALLTTSRLIPNI